jgi:hypothetical protein
VRDVLPQAEKWRIGGGPDAANHTRIMDPAWAAGALPTQAEILSTHSASQETNMDVLSDDGSAQVPLLVP